MEGYSLKKDEKGDVTQTFVLFTLQLESAALKKKALQRVIERHIMNQNVVNDAVIRSRSPFSEPLGLIQ